MSANRESDIDIVWLGQGGYIFDYKGQRVVIDPFLSDVVYQKQGIARLQDTIYSAADLRADYVLITHDHLDHFDPITVAEIHHANPQTIILGPQSVITHANKLGIDPSILRLISMESSIHLGDFFVKVTPAKHSDPYAVGFIMQVNGMTMYISGDTLWYDALPKEIRQVASSPIDFAFIVINGKLGNMNAKEAASLAGMLNVKCAIPMHYGMFAENTEDPGIFLDACRAQRINTKIFPFQKIVKL